MEPHEVAMLGGSGVWPSFALLVGKGRPGLFFFVFLLTLETDPFVL